MTLQGLAMQVKLRAQTRSGPVCHKVDTDRGPKKKDSAMWCQVVSELGRLLGTESVNDGRTLIGHPGVQPFPVL